MTDDSEKDALAPNTSASPDAQEKDEGRVELPSWNRSRRKRRANVKAEAAEDGFQRGVRKAGRRAIGRPQLTMIGLALLLSAVGITSYVVDSEDVGATSATRALATAAGAQSRGIVETLEADQLDEKRIPPVPIFDTEEARAAATKGALEALSETSEDDVEMLGALVAGSEALAVGDAEAATKHYNTFLAAAADDHPLRFLGLEGRAFALEASGDLEGALATFEQIAPKAGDFYRDATLWQRGRVLEALNRTDDAVALYRSYVQEYPKDGSLARGKVRDRLEKLDPAALEGLSSNPISILDGAAGL